MVNQGGFGEDEFISPPDRDYVNFFATQRINEAMNESTKATSYSQLRYS